MQTMRSPDRKAVELHAEANPSDPFAYQRMHLHLSLGLDDPRKVTEEALRQINVRTMARKAKEQ
jgi:hypothetical protein